MLALMGVFLLAKESACINCESLKNISVLVRTDQGNTYHRTVEGCIERAAFEDVIVQAYVKNQSVPRLGRDSVRNMKHLHSVQFYRCQLNTVEPGAFRNVPNLRSIQIVGNELNRVYAGVFQLIPNLEILKMNRNKIDTIEDGSFYNVTTLKKVYLENNLLESWSRLWFASNKNLQVINLQFNKIKTLPKRAFQGLGQLKEIYFDYNELENIGPEAFVGLKKLDCLGLKHNRLKSIDHRAFPNEMVIKMMMIDANYLNFLPKVLLRNIDIREMTIDGNPWKCPCLDEILSRLYETNATVTSSGSCSGENIPVCSFPSSRPKFCTELIDEEVTVTYLQEMLKLSPLLGKYCVRLER